MQAIDLEPEEPVMRTSQKHDRRRHITGVLLLILQVVNSELAAKRQSSETTSQAVTFVAQHSRMMQRVLREASVGNLNGWEPGEKEAELAALVLSLVTRLSFSQLSQQPGAPAGSTPSAVCFVACAFVCLQRGHQTRRRFGVAAAHTPQLWFAVTMAWPTSRSNFIKFHGVLWYL